MCCDAIIKYQESISYDSRIDFIGPQTKKEAEFEVDMPSYTAWWRETNMLKKEKAERHFRVAAVVMLVLFIISIALVIIFNTVTLVPSLKN